MRKLALALLTALLVIVVAAVTGCGETRVITRPGKTVTRDRLVVEPVADTLTEQRPIAEGPLADCPNVARDRKRELEIANAQLHAIRIKHGPGAK